jgi:hypothetical protein
MKWTVWKSLAAIPAVAIALGSHLAICPACWPLVGGLMAALGVTSLAEIRFMLPLFIGALLLAIVPLGLNARRQIGPFALGLLACALILSGKFAFAATGVTLGGVAVLVGAYVWSYRTRSGTKTGSCCNTCAPSTEPTAPVGGKTDIPIACALDKAQFAERQALLEGLAQGAAERKAVPNGFAFRFGSESGLVTRLASFIELERACCPFLTFRIDVKAEGTVWLELTGPPAAREIIRELIPKTA